MIDDDQAQSISERIQERAYILSRELTAHMDRTVAPESVKILRKFSSAEASQMLDTSDSNLRKMHTDEKIKEVEIDSRGRRKYSGEEIIAIRHILAEQGRNTNRYRPGRRSPDDHLIVTSFANLKGGSSKSTSALNIVQNLAMRGYRCMIIDLDPQATLTMMFGYRPEIDFNENGTIYDVLTYEDPVPLSQVIRKTFFPNLDLVPSGILLSEYETETALNLSKRTPGSSTTPFYNRLSQAIQAVEADYDVIFIDCPPQIGFLTLTALMASTGVIVPVFPAMFDVASMAQFLQLAANLMRAIEDQGAEIDWDFMKFMVTNYVPTETAQSSMVGFLRMMLADDLLEHPVYKSTAILNAANTHQTIYEIHPGEIKKKTLDRARDSMNEVSDEVHGLIQKAWRRDEELKEDANVQT